MPHIEISGLEIPRIKILSKELSESLSKAINCPIDWITFSVGALGDTNIFCDGNLIEDTAYIHVEWFDRGADVKQTVANIITEGVFNTNKLEFPEIKTVDVIFVDLKKTDYFENGEHF